MATIWRQCSEDIAMFCSINFLIFFFFLLDNVVSYLLISWATLLQSIPWSFELRFSNPQTSWSANWYITFWAGSKGDWWWGSWRCFHSLSTPHKSSTTRANCYRDVWRCNSINPWKWGASNWRFSFFYKKLEYTHMALKKLLRYPIFWPKSFLFFLVKLLNSRLK